MGDSKVSQAAVSDEALKEAHHWGAAVDTRWPLPLLSTDVVIKHDVIGLHPPIEEIVELMVSTFDTIFPEGMTDLYCRLTQFGHGQEVAMTLPSPSHPDMMERRREIEAIACTMLQPALHIVASYDLEFGHLLHMRPRQYAEEWAGGEHTVQETVQELHRLSNVRCSSMLGKAGRVVVNSTGCTCQSQYATSAGDSCCGGQE